VIFLGIFVAFIVIAALWGSPSECSDKHGEFSFSRYFFGAIFSTIGIGLFFIGHPIGWGIGFLMLIGGYALQNREIDEPTPPSDLRGD
jgi:hypothetical protein